MSTVLDSLFCGAEGQALRASARAGKSVSVFGLTGLGKYALAALCGAPALVVAPDYFAAGRFFDGIKPLVPGALLLPAKEDVLAYHQGVFGGSAIKRFAALLTIARGEAPLVVTTAQAVLQLYPAPAAVLGAAVTLSVGGEYDLTATAKRLTAAGYTRQEQVSDAGQFSLRGDLMDVWPADGQYPARLEFFGDTLEKIKLIDVERQTSAGLPDSISICPFTDLFMTEAAAGEAAEAVLAEISDALESDAAERARGIAGEAGARLIAGDRSAALSLFLPYTKTVSLFEFGGFTEIIYDGAKQVFDAVSAAQAEHAARFAALFEKGETLASAYRQYVDAGALNPKARQTAFQSIEHANRLFQPEAVYTFRMMDAVPYVREMDMLIRDVKNWGVTGYRVLFAAGRELNAWVRTMLEDAGMGYSDPSRIQFIDDLKIENGAIFHDDKCAVIGAYDLSSRPQKSKLKRRTNEVFSELKPGDYVVHEFHGIGVFERVTKLEMGDIRRDYLEIRYADSDKLYVPVENMEALSRYNADTAPVIHKIGGTAFAKAKARVRASVKQLAVNLFELYGARLHEQGHKYEADDSLLHEFERSCGFVETDDQLTAVDAGLTDLKSGKIMDRLLCGDVGYGKTEVALRLAFKVIAEGKQVAFLSPTTILARQHFETVKRRMEPFGVRAVRLTRFDSPAQQRQAVEDIKAGKADIAVGTHRLLSKDIGFSDLGLLILDEEQRFGVSDKEQIKSIRNNVNVLSLSATPIPRTLHMSLSGIRDISILDTPPVDRIPVQTYVTEYTETLVTDAVSRELARGGQVFVVYNRVATIDRFAFRLQKLLPGVRLAVAHGQMDEKVLERTIGAFVEGETDVLVSSTIIENGIDIPRANTMLVVDSDRLGLSQLYQLRGRVGRSNRTAYVFFTYESGKLLSETAVQRLESVMQFTELGSGFKIAMRDLEIRGAGNVMGAEQHGHMERVGYDLYVKLLKEAVAELKGEAPATDREVKVLTDYSTFIPEDYIGEEKGRVRLYARIARINGLKERDRLIGEVSELYGPPPESMRNLLNAALAKNLAGRLNASAVSLKRGHAAVCFEKLMDVPEPVHRLAVSLGAKLSIAPPELRFSSNTEMLKFLLQCQRAGG